MLWSTHFVFFTTNKRRRVMGLGSGIFLTSLPLPRPSLAPTEICFSGCDLVSVDNSAAVDTALLGQPSLPAGENSWVRYAGSGVTAYLPQVIFSRSMANEATVYAPRSLMPAVEDSLIQSL